jgi:hypothetical protein
MKTISPVQVFFEKNKKKKAATGKFFMPKTFSRIKYRRRQKTKDFFRRGVYICPDEKREKHLSNRIYGFGEKHRGAPFGGYAGKGIYRS